MMRECWEHFIISVNAETSDVGEMIVDGILCKISNSDY